MIVVVPIRTSASGYFTRFSFAAHAHVIRDSSILLRLSLDTPRGYRPLHPPQRTHHSRATSTNLEDKSMKRACLFALTLVLFCVTAASAQHRGAGAGKAGAAGVKAGGTSHTGVAVGGASRTGVAVGTSGTGVAVGGASGTGAAVGGASRTGVATGEASRTTGIKPGRAARMDTTSSGASHPKHR